MKIQFIGHAGFIINADQNTLIMDPWLSASGAFDKSWFQFPPNNFLLEQTKQAISNNSDNTYIYISHEHKDHFDRLFLKSIVELQPTILIPEFISGTLYKQVQEIGFKKIIRCQDGKDTELDTKQQFTICIYIDDNQLNRDSGILVKYGNKQFLNLNDCKIFDRLENIKREKGTIDVFSCQFSGASWHPTSYQYNRDDYEKISLKKRSSKFIAVSNAIKTLKPKHYLPAAGPVCFLDPINAHLNFEKLNIFPHQFEIINFLTAKIEHTKIHSLMPGDIFDTQQDKFTSLVEPRYENTEQIQDKIKLMQYQFSHLFQHDNTSAPEFALLDKLEQELANKLSAFQPETTTEITMYFSIKELDEYIVLDFCSRTINRSAKTQTTLTEPYYHVELLANQAQRLTEKITCWEDIALGFKLKLKRAPDIYDQLIETFLIAEAKELPMLIQAIERKRNNIEKVEISTENGTYLIDKYCPHQGANLEYGWAEGNKWVCPKHRWRFDLEDDGKCHTSKLKVQCKKLN